MRDKYSEEEINTLDGLKIDFKDSWVHLRKSNTNQSLEFTVKLNLKMKQIY